MGEPSKNNDNQIYKPQILEDANGIDINALKEKIRSGSKADKLHKLKIVKEKLREQAEKDKEMDDSDQSTDNEFSNFKPPRSRTSIAKSEITEDEPINDEPVTYRKKRKTCNDQVEETSKSDLFDYESLAKQENLILQLVDS